MSAFATVVRRVLNTCGLEVSRYLSPNTLEGHLHRLLPGLGVTTVLDVGANVGQYASDLRRLGYRGRIMSFEPASTTFAQLQRNRWRDPRWNGVQCALGAQNGQLPLNIPAATDLASFRQPAADVADVFGGSMAAQRQELVNVYTLDTVRPALLPAALERLYLKLDTQGYDMEVIAGGAQTLRDVVGLQAEVAVHPLYEQAGPPFPLNLQSYMDLGFELTGLFGVSRDRDWLAQLEFDAVFRRPGRPAAACAAARAWAVTA